MTHYFCLATGMADCTPNDQQYHSAETVDEMRDIIATAMAEWIAEYRDRPSSEECGDEFYQYEFRAPRDGEDNWSQRLLIGASEDWVLDVIGMTEDEWNRESEDLS